MNKKLLFLLPLLFAISARAQQKVIQLYNGTAPGSESWTWDEQENTHNMSGGRAIYNVSHPTLTVFPADSTYTPTGTAVIICPGGGFQALVIDNQGTEEAKWFQKKGITAFVLRYRLIHTLGNDPFKEQFGLIKSNPNEYDKKAMAMSVLATSDGKAAIAYVRQHAVEYGISPSRIGILGFSAGAYIVTETATDYTALTRPDFAAPIYGGGLPEASRSIPQDAPPLFICAATNDQFGSEKELVQLYDLWIKEKHSAELHIFSKGQHGFGMNKQDLESDGWINEFGDWLDQQGFITPAFPNKKGKVSLKHKDDFSQFMDYLLHNDWPVISHYKDKNDSIKAHLNPDEKRIVFMGNSITEGWGNFDPAFFAGRPYINRGISGQTTSQMLARFREDVVDLKPTVVTILAGINDIAQNTGPISVENIFGNIQSMAELAHASGIKVVLSSVMPAATISWRPAIDPVQKIIDLNKLIKAYANKMGYGYIDYYPAMVAGDNKALNPNYTNEGLHPNLNGYKVMEPLAEKAIANALKNKTN